MNFRKWVSENKIDILLVLGLYLLALGIRAAPADHFPNIMGFDSFWAARHTQHIIEGGWFPYNETMIDYPYGRIATPSESGWWLLNAGTYKLTASLMGVNGFDYDLFGKVASWNTAIFGALAIPAVYLFLRKAFNRAAGLAGALFLSGSVAHLQYSIYAHAENDALGLSLLFVALYTFLLAARERKPKYLVINFLAFSWLSLTWQSYLVAVFGITATMIAWFTFLAVMKMAGYLKEPVNKRRYIVAMASILPALLVTQLIGPTRYVVSSLLPLVGAVLYCSLLQLVYFEGKKIEKVWKEYRDPVVFSSLLAIVLVGIFAPVYSASLYKAPLSLFGISLGGTAGEKPDYVQRLDTTIAEQQKIGGSLTARLEVLSKMGGAAFGIFIWTAFIGGLWALVKTVLVPLIKERRWYYEFDALVGFIVIAALVTQSDRIQTAFFLSGIVALGTGYFFGQAWNMIKLALDYMKKSRLERLAKVGLLSLVLLLTLPYNMFLYNVSSTYSYDVPPSWWETFKFIDRNIPNGSVFAFWWDYGHWIAYFNGKKVSMLTDNVHSTPGSIYVTAASFTHTPPCRRTSMGIVCDASPEALERAELESLSILKPFGTTHILIDKEMVVGKFGAPQRIANNVIGSGVDIPCDTANNRTLLVCFVPVKQSRESGVSFYPIVFSYDEKKGILYDPSAGKVLYFNETWPGDRNVYTFPALFQGRNVTMRVFFENDSSEGEYYKALSSLTGYGVTEQGWLSLMDWYNKQLEKRGVKEKLVPDVDGRAYTMFAVSPEVPAFYSFLYRLYFKDPSLKHVKLVYDNGWNKIYEINWEGVPDPDKFPRKDPDLPAWTEQFLTVYKNRGR